jgi:arabinose-5-phosphate isomerase
MPDALHEPQAYANDIGTATFSDEALIELGREVLQVESDAVASLIGRLGKDFVHAVRLILKCRGRVVVSGIGKSGHVGRKIAATLASTGTPAFFVHPAEASHGDLGMITPDDVAIVLSNSGESAELVAIVPLIKRHGTSLIAITGSNNSTLATLANVHLDCAVEKEACPLGLAPTSSTTAALALGDALAVALLKARGFSAQDFARSHPGGKLGRRLLVMVSDVMHTGKELPTVSSTSSLTDALLEMSAKGLGMTAIVDSNRRILGIFTDGDLRRVLADGTDLRSARIVDLMKRNPKTIDANRLAAEAVQQMETLRINGMLVVDAEDRLIGVFNMHDLLRAGVL